MNAETILETLPAPAAESGSALAEASPEAALWARLSMKQRATVEAKTVLVRTVIALIDTGLSDSRAIDLLLARIESGRVAPAIAAACARLGHDGTVLSRATLYRYLKAWRKSGLLGLAPKHKVGLRLGGARAALPRPAEQAGCGGGRNAAGAGPC